MVELFIPHKEIPNHYTVREGYHLVTTDMKATFNYSRLVRKNCIPLEGFLSHSGAERIDVRVYHQPSYKHQPAVIDPGLVYKQLEDIMVDGRETAFHYVEKGEVMVIVTGIRPDVFETLPEQFKHLYYDNLK